MTFICWVEMHHTLYSETAACFGAISTITVKSLCDAYTNKE